MVRGYFFADGERALQEGLGLGKAALRAIKRSEVMKVSADLLMIRAQRLLRDSKGAGVKGLGLSQATLNGIDPSQVVEYGSDVMVMRAKRFFGNDECPL